MTGGEGLRALREKLGMTLRDVESASFRIAERRSSQDYTLSISRISDIETKGVVPHLFRLYTFSAIYRCDIRDIMAMYGIDVDNLSTDLDVVQPTKTHGATVLDALRNLRMPTKLDPQFDPSVTTEISKFVIRWGSVSTSLLQKIERSGFSYGYIGTEDVTMYPILLPGSFVQIDTSRRRIEAGGWASEYERPIYFLETRDSSICSWCAVEGINLSVVPHPLSPAVGRVLNLENEVDVIGRVVGVAMRFDERISIESGPTKKAPSRST